MASTGKGKRKVKGKTLDLSSFLGDQNAPTGFAVVTPRRDWADCVEEENDDKFPGYWKEDKKIVLPTAPKAARGPDFDISRIPSDPPFTAYIGNLPYDIVEEEIMRFFANLRVTSVRLPRDGGDRGRMRGFGYAEFENRQDLIEALALNGETLKNRPVKVSLAGENVKVSLAGENENDRGDRKNDGIDRTASDWRSTPKAEDSLSTRMRRNSKDNRYEDSDREPYRGRNSFDDRNRSDADRSRFDGGADRNRFDPGCERSRFDGDRNRFNSDRNRYDGNRPSYQGRRSTERDYGFGSNDRDRDRGFNRRYGEGGFESFDRNRGFDRGEARNDYDFRRDDRDRGFNRSGRSDRKSDYDSQRDDPEPRNSDESDRDRPKERIKLQLKPRSVPVEQTNAPAAPESVSVSIFGGAKPVDTAAKEREIELRLAKEKERLEDISKPKFLSDRTKEENVIKKVVLNKYNEEPLREKNRARDDHSTERSSTDHHSGKNGYFYSSPEQENGEPVTLLSNKFAHLPTQEE